MLQVMLLEEAPFETLFTANQQPVKSKLAKDPNAKNTFYIPVPDSGESCSCIGLDVHPALSLLMAIFQVDLA